MNFGRGLRILFGLIVAWGAGILALAILALVTPDIWNAGLEFLKASALSLFLAEDPAQTVLAGSEHVQRLAFAALIMPVALSAAVAESFRIGSFLWHAIAPAVIAAISPWLVLQAGSYPASGILPSNPAVTAVLFASGIVGGTVYRLIACSFEPATVRRS